MIHYLEYVKVCFDLVIESEQVTQVILPHNAEAYLVHLMARNFERTDIGEYAIALQMLENLNKKNKAEYDKIGDECLLIQSYPLKKGRWPSETYYAEMGKMAYYLADNHDMEKSFFEASQVLSSIFRKLNTQ